MSILAFRCQDCGHTIEITPEEHLSKYMRMTPVCAECGSIDVRQVSRIKKEHPSRERQQADWEDQD